MATTTESRLNASVNGDLVNRVQALRLDNQLAAGPARNSGSLLPWILCALLAITWVGVGVRWYKSVPQSALAPTGQPAPSGSGLAPNLPPPSSGSQPIVAQGEMVIQLKGIVIPSLQVTVSPRDVGAEITNIYFSEGKRVKEGEILATLVDHQYANRLKTEEAAVKAAEAIKARAVAAEVAAVARVAKAKAALSAAEARLTRALKIKDRADKDYEAAKMNPSVVPAQEYRRYEADKLVADADKLAADADVRAAQREVEAAEADVITAKANVASATEDLNAAIARRDEARRLVENCTVRAPIDGTILTKSADKGALVSPMSFNVAAGICTIADLAKLEVEIDVPERQITRLKPGQACVLQADADPTREYRGVVDRIMPIADDTKNVVKVRIRVYLKKDEEQGTFLKPKMGITATVYETRFQFDPQRDFPWGDEAERQPFWDAAWTKK